MTYKRVSINLDDLARRYHAGESVLAMARAFNVSRQVITRRLNELNLPIRSASEANWLRAKRATPEQRRATALAANAARRQKSIDFSPRQALRDSAMVSTAKTHSRRTGKGESELANFLIARGLTVERQLPVYGYNLDIATWPVAVEVWWGEGYPLRHGHQARRTVELADLGWWVIYVWLSRKLPTETGANAVVTFYELAGRNPLPVNPQYRVVRGDGELVTSGQADRHHLALVPAPHHRTQ